MTKKADFTDNAAKAQTRESNLWAMQQSYVLWPKHKKLLVDDWVELAGMECPSLDLVGSVLAPQARFIGVDMRPEIIKKCREIHSGKSAEWVRGDLIDLVMNRD